MKFSKVEPSYTSKDGCRLVWEGKDEDDSDTVILNKKELDELVEILKKDVTGKINLEDLASSIMVNSDVTQFTLQNHRHLEVDTFELQKKVLEFAEVPHEPKYVHISSKEFYPSVWVRKEKKDPVEFSPKKTPQKPSLLQAILSSKSEKKDKTQSETDVFRIFSTRRSTRKFSKDKVEDWKIDKILAAADTAPTAGNFQGLKIFYIKNKTTKEALVDWNAR